jgi:hypothetical protein
MDRALLVYKTLEHMLKSPASFGLGRQPPKALIEALRAMRQCLGEKLMEENDLLSRDWLSCELSQDADRCPKSEQLVASKGKSR